MGRKKFIKIKEINFGRFHVNDGIVTHEGEPKEERIQYRLSEYPGKYVWRLMRLAARRLSRSNNFPPKIWHWEHD